MPHAVGGRHLGPGTCRSTTAQHNSPGGIPRLLDREKVRPAQPLQRLFREKGRPAQPLQRLFREKGRPARPLQRLFREKVRPAHVKTPILGCFERAGRTFSRSHTHQATQGELFRAQGATTCDIETTITTAHPQQGNAETDIATAPEKRAKNNHFAPAKAMTVSVEAQPAPAKATAVSTPHRHNRAKATAVSGKRAAWSAEPGHSARGLWLGQSAAPVGNIRYKRRQTGAV